MTLEAGAAAADISPTHPVALFGYPRATRVSTGVHDPLLASALYLENGSHRAILIALDLLFLDPPTARSMREAVARRTSVPQARVFISCTHTHSGPVTGRLLAWQDDPTVVPPDPRYLESVERAVANVAAEAASRARPAEMAWTTADARGVGGNRIAPGGVTDPEVGVLAVREAGGGAVVAVAVVCSMHPTVLHEDSTLVSSDFPHYARQHLQERMGRDLTVVYHTAPCGNQSPRYYVSGQTFEEAERLGRNLGQAVEQSLSTLRDGDFSRHCPLAGALQDVDLPARTMMSVPEAQGRVAAYQAEYERFKAARAEPARVRTAQCALFGAQGAVTLARAQQHGEIARTLDAYCPMQAQVLRIGDACLAGLPGELFVEYALQIKRRSPHRVFVVSLVNGELQGYIVTAEAEAAGGYEALTSLFAGPQAGALLVDATLDLLAAQATS